MTLHKIFKELQKLSATEVSTLHEALREYGNFKRLCDEMGVVYSDKKCIAYIKRTYVNRNCAVPSSPGTATTPVQTIDKIKDIIIGTNLDIIEEAAKKKGLI